MSSLNSTQALVAFDFYFDFSSPYAYIAAEKVDVLAASYGAVVNWKPFLLGAVFKQTGGRVLINEHDFKASYAVADFPRTEQMNGLPYRHPTKFPQMSATACRATAWIAQTHGNAAASAFAKEVLRALFVRDGDINDAATLSDIAQSLSIDSDAMLQATQDPAIKALVASQTDAAIAAKVFGSPMFVIDGERFWGTDRMVHLEQRLKEKVGSKGYKTMLDQALANIVTLSVDEALALHGDANTVFVDIRDPRELEREGVIPGAMHAPRGMIEFWVDPKSPYHKSTFDPAKQIVFFCSAGWRSALTTETVQHMAVLPKVAHIDGGFTAWKLAGAPTADVPVKTAKASG